MLEELDVITHLLQGGGNATVLLVGWIAYQTYQKKNGKVESPPHHDPGDCPYAQALGDQMNAVEQKLDQVIVEVGGVKEDVAFLKGRNSV